MKRFVSIGIVFCLFWVLTGCETVKGVGRDITKAGEAIEDATR